MFFLIKQKDWQSPQWSKLSCIQPITEESMWMAVPWTHQSVVSQSESVSMMVGVIQSSKSSANSRNLFLTASFSMHSAPPRLLYWVSALLTSAIQVQALFWLLVTHHFEWSPLGSHVLWGPRTFFIVLMLYTLWSGSEQSEEVRSFWQPQVCTYTWLLTDWATV